MKKTKRQNLFLIILGIAVLLFIFLLIILFGNNHEEKMIKVGFIMTGEKGESGWNGIHYQGIEEACEEFGAELIVKENVKEFTGQCAKAVEELAKEGIGMIILGSYGYAEEMREVVGNYPDIVFYVNSSEYHEANMTYYFARMYQTRYLSGILAGMKTESDRIGYVAAMPNNEVNRGISAFTLGVRRVNPDAHVIVTWTGNWDDEQKEKEAAEKLIEEKDVDVLTYHQNQNYVIQAADERGVASIGFHEQFYGFSSKYLTSAVYNWYPVYRELVKEFVRGKGNFHSNYWIGIEKGAVDLSKYSSEVTEEMQAEVEKARQEILDGKDVFSGVIYDNMGNLRCGENEVISDEVLLEQFDWYTEGVEFYD
ncbi:MAG: BMP family ABC transporter substrate-binding protein [Suilimivivens sp.]